MKRNEAHLIMRSLGSGPRLQAASSSCARVTHAEREDAGKGCGFPSFQNKLKVLTITFHSIQVFFKRSVIGQMQALTVTVYTLYVKAEQQITQFVPVCANINCVLNKNRYLLGNRIIDQFALFSEEKDNSAHFSSFVCKFI